MLDQLRTHSSSWITKFILGTIVAGLILFFGSSGLHNFRNGDPGMVASVNGETITKGLFEMNYENQIRFYEQIFKGNVSDEIRERTKQSVIDQLIHTKLFAQEARKMGIRISDDELIKDISQNPQFSSDGTFNKQVYLKRFKPAFLKETQVDFEDYMRELLLSEKFEDLTKSSVTVSDNELMEEYVQTNTQFKLEKYSINLDSLKEQIKDPNELEQKIQSIQQEAFNTLSESQVSPAPVTKDNKKAATSPLANFENLKKTYKVEEENTGLHSLKEAASLLGTDQAKKYPEILNCISQLNNSNTWCQKGFTLENKLVFFKLLEKKEADLDKFEKDKANFKLETLNRKQTLVMKQIADSLTEKAKPKIKADLL